MELRKQAGILHVLLAANATTNFMLSTNPEHFERGKCIRHQQHIAGEPQRYPGS
jgi:hypothetical protein